jgi:hypothetical protein
MPTQRMFPIVLFSFWPRIILKKLNEKARCCDAKYKYLSGQEIGLLPPVCYNEPTITEDNMLAWRYVAHEQSRNGKR